MRKILSDPTLGSAGRSALRLGVRFKVHSAVRFCLLSALLAGSVPALAIEAGGVRFEDKISLGGTELQANGAGVRTKFVFDVYAMALYLPAKTGTSDSIIAQGGVRRLAIQLLRDVSAEDFVTALKAGMQANLPDAEFTALKPQIDELVATLLAVKEVRKGTSVSIDYLPGSGTRISIAGQARGKDIAGKAFADAVLGIWLGGKPVQAELKAKLLGK